MLFTESIDIATAILISASHILGHLPHPLLCLHALSRSAIHLHHRMATLLLAAKRNDRRRFDVDRIIYSTCFQGTFHTGFHAPFRPRIFRAQRNERRPKHAYARSDFPGSQGRGLRKDPKIVSRTLIFCNIAIVNGIITIRMIIVETNKSVCNVSV